MSFLNISKSFKDFNKEILSGQVGSFVGAQVAALAGTITSATPKTTSFLIVGGSAIFSLMPWLIIKFHDEEQIYKRVKKSLKNLFRDAEYLLPAFIILGICGYFILFYLSKYLIENSFNSNAAAIIAQFCAIIFFVGLLNLYRIFVYKFFKRKID